MSDIKSTEKNSSKHSNFTHLHVHSQYSLLDGLGKIDGIVKKVKDSGMTACAITDHGVGYGLPEFYNCCKENGIKPILGCEVYEAPGSRFDKSGTDDEKNYFHLILLVKNEIGYKNLCILISRSNTEGFYYKPRIDHDLLQQYHEGLVCLSACIAGRVPQLILSGKKEKVKETALWYRDLFGDDYYFEIQNHGLKEESIVSYELIKMSKELNIKLVCTNDSHYVNSDDAEAHDWLLCVQTGKKVNDVDRMRYYGDYSIKTETEMRALFPGVPEAFDNTMEIADKCNFDFEFGHYRMPTVHIPAEYGEDYFGYLRDEAFKGHEERYPEGNPEREEARRKLEYELGVVKQMGFAEYFLDTRKTIVWAREHDILVGPGRGSAAGSVMCYDLRITDIDPIKYNLLFERFLNPERISMPDIDVDYDYSHKDEVVASEAESNGKDKFAKIQTFGTMKAKGVIRDTMRVAGYDPSYVNMIAKKIPDELGMTLTKAMEINPELKDIVDSDETMKKVWNIALKLEGTKKSSSTHACGHIPTPVPCEQLFPVSVDKKTGYLVCQYNMADAEHLGNLKKDLLMLRNLTVIDHAHRAVKKKFGIDIPLWTDTILNNKEALAMIASGDTMGVFQLESVGMKNFMKELKPDCFEDIIAGVSLYRPGPMDYIPAYIKGKHDPSSITYLTPELESILAPTYGVIVYQEEVMQIVQKLASFSMGRADLVRKGMAKKKQDIMDAERPHFVSGDDELGIKGCVRNGIDEGVANKIYDQMIDFAKYAFNKSHAAAYAAVSMQTAYLKCHYPLEFMTGLLTSVMDTRVKLISYINDCKKRNIKVLPPDINASETSFSVYGDSLRYGLLAIKGVGKAVLENIIAERNKNGIYKDISDLVVRNEELDKRAAEALIKAGAMDFAGLSRRAMLLGITGLIEKCRKERKSQIEGQMSLLDMFDDDNDEKEKLKDNIENMPEFPKDEILEMEKEATGMYISGHPLDEYRRYLEKNTTNIALDFIRTQEESNESMDESVASENGAASVNVADGQRVKIGGIIVEFKKIFTKKDNRPMALSKVEDMYGTISCVVFPKAFAKYERIFEKSGKVILTGNANVEDDKDASVIVETALDLDSLPKKLWIQFKDYQEYEANKSRIDQLSNAYKGKDSIVVYLREQKQRAVFENAIFVSKETENIFRKEFGEKNISV